MIIISTGFHPKLDKKLFLTETDAMMDLQ